jgi:DNA-binding NarL/FixJ family response regulator
MPPLRVLIRAGSAREAANYRELLDEGSGLEPVAEGSAHDVILAIADSGHGAPAIPAGIVPVLILLGEGDSTHPWDLERPGVSVLSDGVSRPQLLAALRAVAAGLTVRDPAIPAQAPRSAHAAESEELTPRERELLTFLGEGYGNREIAAALGLSDHTVKFHLRSIYAKLGARSRTEAVSLAVRRGLLML